MVGLHGVLAFVVTRRTREIGIRIALGAGQGAVVGLVLREILAVVLAGLTAGVAAAYVCGKYVETQLFGVKAADGPVFGISVATLLAASLVAALAPAWRASRIFAGTGVAIRIIHGRLGEPSQSQGDYSQNHHQSDERRPQSG